MVFDGLESGMHDLSVSSYFLADWNYQRRGEIVTSLDLHGDFTLERGFLPTFALSPAFSDALAMGEPLKAVWDFGGEPKYIQNAFLQKGQPYYEVFYKRLGEHSPGDVNYEVNVPISFSDIIADTLPPQWFGFAVRKNGFEYIWDGEYYREYFTNEPVMHYVEVTTEEGIKYKKCVPFPFIEYLDSIGLGDLDQYAGLRVGHTVFRRRWFRAGKTGPVFARYDITRDINLESLGDVIDYKPIEPTPVQHIKLTRSQIAIDSKTGSYALVPDLVKSLEG